MLSPGRGEGRVLQLRGLAAGCTGLLLGQALGQDCCPCDSSGCRSSLCPARQGLAVTSQVWALLWGCAKQGFSLGHTRLPALAYPLAGSGPEAASQALSLLHLTLITVSKGFPAPWVFGAGLERPFPNAGWVQRWLHRSAVCACGRVMWAHTRVWCNRPSCHPIVSECLLQGAATVRGDVCPLVPLIAAWSLGWSSSSLPLVPGPPPVAVNNLPFPAEP